MLEDPQTEFLPPDDALREDVSRLGALVGRMLVEQGGEGLLAQVEAVRVAAIRRRREGAPIRTMAASLAGLEVSTAHTLARAFATYFQVVNVAERVHRIRRRRDYQRAGGTPQPESLRALLEEFKAQGIGADELLGWIDRLWVEPVFTAHPTEAVRRSLLEKEQVIARALVDGFDRERTPQERVADDARIMLALSAGWQTAEASDVQPTVQDEYEHVGFYLANPLYRIVPALYETLQAALREVYGVAARLPQFLGFASWVGGDMDGNPNVGAETLAACLESQRTQIVERYAGNMAVLARELSQTDDRVAVTPALRQRLDAYMASYPDAASGIKPRHADMPYRCLLHMMGERLRATAADEPAAYVSARELLDDLELIAGSLLANRGLHAGVYGVDRLIWRVRTFGLHLARLDTRQDSRAHDDALAILFADPQWAERDVAMRVARLRPYASGERCFGPCSAPMADHLQAVFSTLRDSRRQHGSGATGLYVISMARSAADVLAVLALARRAELVEMESVPLDIAPLFETIDDLQHAPATLQALLDDPVYRRHLGIRDDRQWVMLGYSDSGKDGGTLASRWSLQRAQVRLLEVATAANIRVMFFHGRGGSASRGGARMMPALMSSPRGAVAGVLRMTEQGEVIHRRYAIRALALRNLEQTVGATLRASLRPRAAEPREARWRTQMDALSACSRQAYRELVERDGFVDYFRSATPIDVIERMTLGSRPASRRSMHGVHDLRAIPWVFAWTQCRAIIPGWYGLGSALAYGVREFGAEAMGEMARDWPFFDNALNDVEMVLAKCDLDIAEAFSTLSGPLHEAFFKLIGDEFVRARDGLLGLREVGAVREREPWKAGTAKASPVSGLPPPGRGFTNRAGAGLLQGEPRLAASIRLRNPYVDPMSLLQVDLLRRWRAGDRTDEELLHALVACVNGVSQGLQNTG